MDAMFTLPGMLIDGTWMPYGSRGESSIHAPYDGRLVAKVPVAGPRDAFA